jgi:hypothetical protein
MLKELSRNLVVAELVKKFPDYMEPPRYIIGSQDSVVHIPTGYGLDARGVGVRDSVGVTEGT